MNTADHNQNEGKEHADDNYAAGNKDQSGSSQGQNETKVEKINSRDKSHGFVGASPSSLAALVTGKAYIVDPRTPFTPKPEAIMRVSSCAGYLL